MDVPPVTSWWHFQVVKLRGLQTLGSRVLSLCCSPSLVEVWAGSWEPGGTPTVSGAVPEAGAGCVEPRAILLHDDTGYCRCNTLRQGTRLGSGNSILPTLSLMSRKRADVHDKSYRHRLEVPSPPWHVATPLPRPRAVQAADGQPCEVLRSSQQWMAPCAAQGADPPGMTMPAPSWQTLPESHEQHPLPMYLKGFPSLVSWLSVCSTTLVVHWFTLLCW